MALNKRGQTALEYLVTYGWAILAIVIIAGVLWYFGVFTPGRFAPSEQTAGFSTIIVTGHKVSGSNLTLVVGNQAGEPVNITSAAAGTGTASSPGITIQPNGQATLSGIGTGSTLATGDQYSLNVSITYTLTRTGLTGKVSVGTVSGRAS